MVSGISYNCKYLRVLACARLILAVDTYSYN